MTVLLWCCNWLGYQTLKTLISDPVLKSQFQLRGVVLSSKDEWAVAMRDLLRETQVPLFLDQEALTVEAELGVCLGFPWRLSTRTLAHCHRGVINLHFAPLPAYRGSGTLTWAILNQEKKYGVTLHWMDEQLDTGPIIAQSCFPLPSDQTFDEIEKALEIHAWDFLQPWLGAFAQGQVPAGTPQAVIIRQTGRLACRYTRASVAELYQLNRYWSAARLSRYLRALPIKKNQRPFFVIGARKVFLELECDSHQSHTYF